MTREQLATYSRTLDWFLWTWLGRGVPSLRPRMTLEETLRLARMAHRDHYPTRRALRDVDLALAWLATELHAEEPRRVPAHWRSSRREVPIEAWADMGPGRRVTLTVHDGTHTRELVLEPETTWALLRQLLAAVGHARQPDESGLRTDTVLLVNPLNGRTWTEEEDEPTSPLDPPTPGWRGARR